MFFVLWRPISIEKVGLIQFRRKSLNLLPSVTMLDMIIYETFMKCKL